jgi:hypothetical protein
LWKEILTAAAAAGRTEHVKSLTLEHMINISVGQRSTSVAHRRRQL